MLVRSLFCFGLASLSLALPAIEIADTDIVHANAIDTSTEEHVVDRRSASAIDKPLHDRLIYYSEYAAAAYCKLQQAEGGGKVTCAPAKTCGHVEKSDTKVYNTWLK
jgi:hypothetical protein